MSRQAEPSAGQPSAHEMAAHELAAQVIVQTGELLGQEIALARAELHTKARQLGMGAVLLGTGGFVGFSAWLVLLAAAVAGIAVALPAWAAALIVGATLAALAGALAVVGGRRVSRALPPLPMTVESVRQDLREIREKAWR